jgi:hypothetical protein
MSAALQLEFVMALLRTYISDRIYTARRTNLSFGVCEILGDLAGELHFGAHIESATDAGFCSQLSVIAIRASSSWSCLIALLHLSSSNVALKGEVAGVGARAPTEGHLGIGTATRRGTLAPIALRLEWREVTVGSVAVVAGTAKALAMAAETPASELGLVRSIASVVDT